MRSARASCSRQPNAASSGSQTTSRTPPEPEASVTRIETLLAEFSHETTTTRKHLERLPADRFAWRPHAKSFTAGQLASHIVDCVQWVDRIFAADEFDFNPRAYQPFDATS